MMVRDPPIPNNFPTTPPLPPSPLSFTTNMHTHKKRTKNTALAWSDGSLYNGMRARRRSRLGDTTSPREAAAPAVATLVLVLVLVLVMLLWWRDADRTDRRGTPSRRAMTRWACVPCPGVPTAAASTAAARTTGDRSGDVPSKHSRSRACSDARNRRSEGERIPASLTSSPAFALAPPRALPPRALPPRALPPRALPPPLSPRVLLPVRVSGGPSPPTPPRDAEASPPRCLWAEARSADLRRSSPAPVRSIGAPTELGPIGASRCGGARSCARAAPAEAGAEAEGATAATATAEAEAEAGVSTTTGGDAGVSDCGVESDGCAHASAPRPRSPVALLPAPPPPGELASGRPPRVMRLEEVLRRPDSDPVGSPGTGEDGEAAAEAVEAAAAAVAVPAAAAALAWWGTPATGEPISVAVWV